MLDLNLSVKDIVDILDRELSAHDDIIYGEDSAAVRIMDYVQAKALIATQHAAYGLPLSILETFRKHNLTAEHVSRKDEMPDAMDVYFEGGREITLCRIEVPFESWVIVSWNGKFKRPDVELLATDMAKAWGAELKAKEAAQPKAKKVR
ncbi:hypothetical protein HOU02_gp255 [Caulobacter phage CcrBL9]|uniref:Uncharacterized protein n=1 Tax=Caulobacter phage CcrBL9 TaxID=2283270 RepID=A0A385ECU1_9CAUD|nr:hypothetical protein HOU02_gp255 [Caulobacter phage CcrBL9]AXQ69470.1 hypothetical protein CcrBL9_gp446 [Caulobacter phage CcrBL9]